MSDLANAAAEAASQGVTLTKSANPYTPVFYAICTGIIVQVGWIIRSWVTGIPARTKADSDAEASFRSTLMAEMGALRLRITDLEKAVVDERRSCVEQIRQIEQRHDQEVAKLSGEIKGLRDNMIQQSRSAGTMIALGTNAPTSIQAIADKLGDVE